MNFRWGFDGGWNRVDRVVRFDLELFKNIINLEQAFFMGSERHRDSQY